jgi:hypothetical protein
MMQSSAEVTWRRPTKEFAHPYTLGAVEAYVPKNRADAVLYIGGLGLSEVNDYAGRPDIQADIVATLAAERFPDCFKDVVTLTLVSSRGVA